MPDGKPNILFIMGDDIGWFKLSACNLGTMGYPAQVLVNKWLESFKVFPPRHKAASFTVSDVMEKITTASPNQN